jgi:hypothetical protein
MSSHRPCGFRPAEMEATVKVLYLLKRHNWRMDTSDRERPVQVCDRLRGIRRDHIHILGWSIYQIVASIATPPARQPSRPPACGHTDQHVEHVKPFPAGRLRRGRSRVLARRVEGAADDRLPAALE